MILSKQEINKELADLKGWRFVKQQIQKTYSLKNFKSAIKLTNKIAEIAEKIGHHPDIFINYNKVTFKLSTHSEGGITKEDLKLAHTIEEAGIMN